MTKRRKIILICLVAAVGVLPLLGICVDFIYTNHVNSRLTAWEQTVERDPDGVRLECGAFSVGDGPIGLLMVHGFGDSPYLYTHMADQLAASGFTCRAIRLPGFAEPMERYSQTSLAAWREELQQELDLMKLEKEEVWLVAHSMGGALAIDLLLHEPQAADGLVLLAPMVSVSDRRSPLLSPESWHKLGSSLMIFTDTLENTFAMDMHSPEVDVQAYPRDRFIPVQVYDGLFELMHAIEGRAQDLQIPLLTVLSKEDQVIDWQSAEAYHKAAIGVPRNTLLFQKDAGHVLPLDTHWQVSTAQIIKFIRDNPRPE